jgi:uncharacterized membrane protein
VATTARPTARAERITAPVRLSLALLGLGISAYLTAAHYSSPSVLACPSNSTFNCEKVTTSPQSEVFGIPVAVLGLAYFVFLAGFEVVSRYVDIRVRGLTLVYQRFLVSALGIGFVIYLIAQELLVIKAVCLWCTAVHVVAFLYFLTALLPFLLPAAWPEPVTQQPGRMRSRQRATSSARSAASLSRSGRPRSHRSRVARSRSSDRRA